MKHAILLILILFLVYGGIVYCYSIGYEYFDRYEQLPVSDEELRQLAIEKGMLPQISEDFDMQKEMEAKNTITLWLAMDRKTKIKLMNNLKEMFKQKSQVIIDRSSSYYVNEINGVLYISILKGDIDRTTKQGLRNIFKTIAVMDGDYDDGRNKVEIFKELIGEEVLQEFKKQYPGRYHSLLKVREETIKKLENNE